VTGSRGYMEDPRGSLDHLEITIRQQKVLENVPLIFFLDPYASTPGNAVYVAFLRGRSQELVKQAVVPEGQPGMYQRIQYTTANAYCTLIGTFDAANFQENIVNLNQFLFGVRSELVLTSGGVSGIADPVDLLLPQGLTFPAAGTAVRQQFELDVRGTQAGGGKVADEATPRIRVRITANVVDPGQPIPPRLTLPGFKAVLVGTASSPTNL